MTYLWGKLFTPTVGEITLHTVTYQRPRLASLTTITCTQRVKQHTDIPVIQHEETILYMVPS